MAVLKYSENIFNSPVCFRCDGHMYTELFGSVPTLHQQGLRMCQQTYSIHLHNIYNIQQPIIPSHCLFESISFDLPKSLFCLGTIPTLRFNRKAPVSVPLGLRFSPGKERRERVSRREGDGDSNGQSTISSQGIIIQTNHWTVTRRLCKTSHRAHTVSRTTFTISAISFIETEF